MRGEERRGLRVIGVGESTGGSTLGEESVLQIDRGFSNQIVGTDQIVIHHSDPEIFRQRNLCSHLEVRSEERVDLVWDVHV